MASSARPCYDFAMTASDLMVRPAAVAGTFYPGEAGALGAMVDECLTGARVGHPAPKALIAPHAGFIYSGAIAGTAYATLADKRGRIDRVVILGPPHRVPLRGFAVAGARAFETPLGRVPVDWAAIDRLRVEHDIQLSDAAHAEEHSLETQLPFLQRALGDFAIVPILVGMTAPEQVERLIEALWGGEETLVVISSDLSHYHDDADARRLDGAASRAIEMLQPDQLGEEQACGRHAIRGLLRRARALDLRATTLDLRNSGQTAGTKDRVVGYGGYVFEYGATARLAEHQRRSLLDAAAKSISIGLAKGHPPKVRLGTFAPQLEATRASFVTLTLDGKLRGCIGSLEPHQPLIKDVAENAYKAAFADPRFKPLGQVDAERLEIGISILGTARPIHFRDEAALIADLRPDQDGVILQAGDNRGLFLPHVWESIPDARQFLHHLKVKAGLQPDAWPNGIQAWRFSAESFE